MSAILAICAADARRLAAGEAVNAAAAVGGRLHHDRRSDGHALVDVAMLIDGALDAFGDQPLDTARAIVGSLGVYWVDRGLLSEMRSWVEQLPDIAARLAGISFMGGGLFGNRTATGTRS